MARPIAEALEQAVSLSEKLSDLDVDFDLDSLCDLLKKKIVEDDEERDFDLREEGHEYTTVAASTLGEALEEARSNVDRRNYNECEGILYIDVHVSCELTGESDSDTVILAPEEPECTEGDHDWQSPYEILGGCKENPGVWGHGGGVIIKEVCMKCGCERVTDTWAQRRDTGEQGLYEVNYEPGKYSEEIAQLG